MARGHFSVAGASLWVAWTVLDTVTCMCLLSSDCIWTLAGGPVTHPVRKGLCEEAQNTFKTPRRVNGTTFSIWCFIGRFPSTKSFHCEVWNHGLFIHGKALNLVMYRKKFSLSFFWPLLRFAQWFPFFDSHRFQESYANRHVEVLAGDLPSSNDRCKLLRWGFTVSWIVSPV